MGGFSISALFVLLGMAALLLLGVAVVGAALLVAAAVASVVLACGRKKRAAAGRRLGGKIALPIVLFTVGLAMLGSVAAVVAWISSGAGEEPLTPQTEAYYTATQSITSHDEVALANCLDAGAVDATEYPHLLVLAVQFGDEECAQVVLSEAEEAGRPFDLSQPLPLRYSDTRESRGAEHALILATGFEFHSLEMCQLLIDAGADVNAVALMDESGATQGDTPLHLVCSGMCNWMMDPVETRMADTRAAIDFFLERGANPEALDGEGRTPGDCYRELLGRLVEGGSITQEQADRELAAAPTELSVAAAASSD